MDFGSMKKKVLIVLQLSLLLLNSVTTSLSPTYPPKPSLSPVYPPSISPYHGPRLSPVHPPSISPYHGPRLSPVHPPSLSPRLSPLHAPKAPPVNTVAVEGYVYCITTCSDAYGDLNATLSSAYYALSDAVVQLECNISVTINLTAIVEATTNNDGYFFLEAAKNVTSYLISHCKVFLVSSSYSICDKKTNLNGGVTGATLSYEKTSDSYDVYTTGSLAFQSSSC